MSTTTNIFADILSASTTQAPAPAPFVLAPAFDGTEQEPSEGFIVPVAPATKTLYHFQQRAVESILAHRRILLGLQPGMGKTAICQAVIAAKVAEGERAIVVVPPSLRISPWAEEFAADYPTLRVAVVEGQKSAPIPPADVVIVGDSVIGHRHDDLVAYGASVLVADEAHRFKSRTAKRSVALASLVATLPTEATVVLGTGTLATNNGGDVWKPLHIIGEGVNHPQAKAVSRGASWTRFMDEWLITEQVWTGRAYVRVAKGCRDPLGLRAALTSTCMVNIPRDEVLDLPDRTFVNTSLALNADAAAYRRVEREFLAWVREQHGDDAARRAARAEALVKVMKLWEQDGLAKVRAAGEYISNLVEQQEKVVVMAHHSSVIQGLYSRLTATKVDGTPLRVATIIGGMTADEKADVVNRFQAGHLDVVIGQMEAAGTGLTLTAATQMVFVQTPWSPATFAQASDRIYRIGQQHKVTCHVLTGAEGMVSHRLWDVLQAKAHIVDAINHGKPTTIDTASVQDAVLSGYGW